MAKCKALTVSAMKGLRIVCATCAGMDSILELLVNSGYDVNVQRPEGITALMIACRMVCSCVVHFCTVRLDTHITTYVTGAFSRNILLLLLESHGQQGPY